MTTPAGLDVIVGPIEPSELPVLYRMFEEVVASREGYPHEPPLTAESFDATWVSTVTVTVAARLGARDAVLVGAYYLRPNFVGRAAHIANAGYIVGADHRRRGVGRLLVEDSVWRAPLFGFDAMQFNLVFASNPAQALYVEMGWKAIGRVPDAVDGEDAIIYWRSLAQTRP
jgi:GNAT superfamily N-acetyltransferase